MGCLSQAPALIKEQFLSESCASYARQEIYTFQHNIHRDTSPPEGGSSLVHTPRRPPVWLAQCRHHRSLWLEGIGLPLAGPSANAAAALAPGRLARCTGEWPIEGVPSLFLSMDAVPVPVPLWHDTIVPVENTSGRRRHCRRFRRDSGTGTFNKVDPEAHEPSSSACLSLGRHNVSAHGMNEPILD